MTTERFTKRQFEAALPKHKITGEALWQPLGVIEGEYQYSIQVTAQVKIQVRSSVDKTGFAADTGQNSIRIWLTDNEGQPLAQKPQAWVTRVSGWERRTVDVIRKVYAEALAMYGKHGTVGFCETCGKPKVKRVAKTKKNFGRTFCKCQKCDTGFKWLDN